MKDILAEAGIEVSAVNKKEIDRAIHDIECLKKTDQKWKEQEQRWQVVQEQVDSGPSSNEK